MITAGFVVADRFRLLKQAGKGGTATVFRAFDERADRTVALKVFSDERQSEQILVELCDREARALQKLNHECIVKLVDYGRCTQCGYRYIATEWVDGPTLEDHLADAGPQQWQDFIDRVGADLLDALCHAFEQDVAHRDVSLRNILVPKSGRIKIIDFGHAKIEHIGVGLTVAGWRTPPFSPPEDDTGRFTYTRDPYSFCAVAVRALAGRELADHDQLYEALDQLPPELAVRATLIKALHREPRQRFENILAFRDAVLNDHSHESESEPALTVAIRFAPTAFSWIDDKDSFLAIPETENAIVSELNDAAAVRLLPDSAGPNRNRVQIETASHRMVLDIDSARRDHLVVVGAAPKRFSLDGLYKGDAWITDVSFVPSTSSAAKRGDDGRKIVLAFYSRIEQALSQPIRRSRAAGDAFLDQWSRVLDAMREVESARVPSLTYKLVEVSGRRLIVDVENYWDAREEQVRTISRFGSPAWVFRGEIERIEGSRCTLYSKTYAVRAEEIPLEGVLAHDWSQTRKALDRQASALERFRGGSTPSDAVRRLLLREQPGAADPSYAGVGHFFDQQLNDEKKTLVSQFLANRDLLLVHGPPGTGKTKVIVEIVRQELARNPTAKILLVSQTHVALDHALVGLVEEGIDAPAVRIVSGTKAMNPAVEHCSVDARGQQLQEQVERASIRFVADEARKVGVDFSEVELGIRASEVLRLRAVVNALNERCSELNSDLSRLQSTEATTTNTTTQRDEIRARMKTIDEELQTRNDELLVHRSQLAAAVEALVVLGPQGRDLSAQDDNELAEWCRMLLDGPTRARLRRLVNISEEWRMKFATSDDFKAAIIASSKIVAGTCVGFCREAAASRAEYDICIVDEASKATTTELLLPLSRCKKAVLVGDHHQLPPFVEHALKSAPLISKYNLSPNILEAQLFESLQEDLAAGQKATLRLQYRMRGSIGRLVSQCFYRGELDTELDPNEVSPFGSLALAGLSHRVVWKDLPLAQEGTASEVRSRTSYVNHGEVRCIVDLLLRIRFVLRSKRRRGPLPTIAVISGYNEQVVALRREIARQPELAGLDIECNSVHSFQGREVDICIYSVTRNNLRFDIGFLDDWRHLNVALSRALWHLVIVGSWQFCLNIRGENPFASVQQFITTDPDCERREASDAL